jgi:hypothetical protein
VSEDLSFDCADHPAFARAIEVHPWMAPMEEQEAYFNDSKRREQPVPPDFAAAVAASPTNAEFIYRRYNSEGYRAKSYLSDALIQKVILIDSTQPPMTVRDYFRGVQQLPFEVGSYGRLYNGFKPECNIGMDHFRMGPALGFRGAGHARICSPRLLALGPWYVHRDEASDTTVIQFHADDADGDVARQQSSRGHRLCHFRPDEGGGRYIVDSQFCTFEAFTPIYIPARRVYRIHQPAGERASSTKMADCNALRFHSRIDPKRFAAIEVERGGTSRYGEDRTSAWPRLTPLLTEPFDEIEFFFEDPVDAWADLMELYIRGFPVYAQFPDGERRLDITFQPPRAPTPDWVKDLQAKYG